MINHKAVERVCATNLKSLRSWYCAFSLLMGFGVLVVVSPRGMNNS